MKRRHVEARAVEPEAEAAHGDQKSAPDDVPPVEHRLGCREARTPARWSRRFRTWSSPPIATAVNGAVQSPLLSPRVCDRARLARDRRFRRRFFPGVPTPPTYFR